jgi:hypothetical protein
MKIDLPPHCYTRKYLKQSGINYLDSILDTNYKCGLEKVVTRSFIMLFCLIILAIFFIFILKLKMLLIDIFLIDAIIFFLYEIALLGRYFFLLKLRNNIREDKAPILLEPIAIVYEQRFSLLSLFSSYKSVKSVIVYKEVGAAKPLFYAGAVNKGLPKELPAKNALLYKHRTNLKYYSIDDEYDLVKEKSKQKNKMLQQAFN